MIKNKGPMKLCKCGRFINIDENYKFVPHKIAFTRNSKWCVFPKTLSELIIDKG